MDRNIVGPLALAALSILALTLAAATLTTTVSVDRPERAGSGTGQGGFLPPADPSEPPPRIPIPFLTELLIILSVLVLLGFLAYVFVHRRRAAQALVLVIVLGVVMFVLFALLEHFGRDFAPSAAPSRGFGNSSLRPGSGGSDARSSAPSIGLLFILIVALFGAVGALIGVTSKDDTPASEEPVDDADSTTATTAAVGRAAGRAADRIERESDIDNEVYRAWREMTELIDVPNPDSSTPGEFATAAIDAGMAREDVLELTRLFEEVRYGGEAPSEQRENRAVGVFRRIEAAYAEEA